MPSVRQRPVGTKVELGQQAMLYSVSGEPAAQRGRLHSLLKNAAVFYAIAASSFAVIKH